MTVVTLTTASTDPWVAPAGVTSVQVQCWAEGGNGVTAIHPNLAGAGGGGGEFAQENTVAVTPGNSYSWSIGSGGSGTNTVFPGDSLTVTAHAGASGSSTTGGSGGSGSSNSTHYSGGNGGAGFGGNDGGGGGGGGAGSSGAGGAGGGYAPGGGGGGSAGSGSGGAGGSGGVSNSGNGSRGSTLGGGGGGGGSGTGSGLGAGSGAAGQIVLTYTATTTIHGTASWTGSGSLTPAKWVMAGHAALSGSGAMTTPWSTWLVNALSGSGSLSGTGSTQIGVALSGSGTLGLVRTVVWTEAAALSGSGTLVAGTIQAVLSGTGTLGVPGFTLHPPPVTLSGTGTLSVIQVLGGLVSATAGAGTPYAYPGSSQVAVAAPGSANWMYLGSIGTVTALTYSYTCPGGPDAMTCTVMVPASYRTQMFNPGWNVRITRGGHQIWDGVLDEPVPTASGWNLTAVGTGNLGTNYLAIYTGTWPAGQPDDAVNEAIARGLPWINPGIGTPAGAWYGQAVDSGAQTITALLNLLCTRGALTWYVNSQPGGQPGDDLSVFPLPATVNRLLVCTTPVARTLGGDINTIWIRYEVAADTTDSSGNSIPAVYAVTSVQNAQSVAAHGVLETYIDLSDVGVQTAAAAQAVGAAVLQIYQRASFAGPFTASYGQLLNTGGVSIDPGTDQAGNVVRLILCDFAYGGEVTPEFPVQFCVGSYSWDDFAQVATLNAYQNVDQSLTGLLSLANTELTPIAAASS